MEKKACRLVGVAMMANVLEYADGGDAELPDEAEEMKFGRGLRSQAEEQPCVGGAFLATAG